MVTVEDLMSKFPYFLTADRTVKEAIELMRKKNIGSVVIVNQNKEPVNIITERDIIFLLSEGNLDLKLSEALELLKKNSEFCAIGKNAPITTVIRLFREKAIKHLPVVDDSGKLIGIISSSDVIQKLAPFAFIDPLTLLGNRNYLKALELRFGVRRVKNAAVLMIDIDDFKKVNDTYGHSFGDIVLKCVAEAILKNLRAFDEAVRYGGEEFVTILYRINKENAVKVAERISNVIKGLYFPQHPELKITVSIGICLFSGGAKEFRRAIVEADKNMYLAKKAGKDRIFYSILVPSYENTKTE